MYVVSAVRASNGLGGLNALTYTYGGARAHVRGRGFSGFAWMEITNPVAGLVTRTEYAQAFPYSQTPTRSTQRWLSDNTLVQEATYTLATLNPSTGTHFPYVAQSVERNYELGGTLVTQVTTTNTYDTFGNATELVIATNDGFTTRTVNTYTNDTTKWHLGRLTRAEVTHTAPGGASATRVSTFAYAAATGLLTKETIEPGTGLEQVTTYTLDAFGNRTAVSLSGPGVSARTASTTYDAAGRFPIGSANALGHTETRSYDARFGTPASQTGPNGLTTTWQVDSFGRTVLETRPDGTTTATQYGGCASGCPAGAVRKVTVIASGAAPIITYFDVLGREIRTETVGFDGRAVYQDTEYDALGRVARTSLPYYSNEPAYYARTTYDLMDRPVTQTAPDDSVTTTAYDGYTTALTNALGQTTTRLTNSQGQLVRVTDALGGVVTYAYDPLGNLTRVTDPAGNVTTQTFDVRGRKVAMNDPDLGAWTYAYNAFGELTSQTDAKGQTITQAYDALGRMISRTAPEGTTTWAYDTAAHGIGQLASVLAPGGYAQDYLYDTLGRLTRTDTTTDTVTRSLTTSYDAFSRPDTLTYPSGFAVQHSYTAQGYLAQVRNAATQALFWQADAARPDGMVSAFRLGNGLSTVRLYDARRGDLIVVSTGFGTGTTVQHLTYTWDALGNLTARHDVNQDLTESFTYDALNRLTAASIAGIGSKTYAYNAIGNLTSKSDVGNYTYGAKPHAVTAAGANAYAYDANGNMTSGAGRTITWDSANRATQIIQGAVRSTLFYAPDGARWKQVKTAASGAVTTVRYLGTLYEEITAAGVTEQRHYVYAGTERIAVYSTKTSGQTSLKYLHQDHLGSTDTVTDASGGVLERLSYDPHGKRRNANWTGATGTIAAIATDRGYTGHEHLDEVGLIHMNGRVYDPTLGRFLSADPIIQFPEASQGLNRYSYVLNNPLSYTDPTGLFLGSVFKAIGKAFKAVFKAIGSVFRNLRSVAAFAFYFIPMPGVNVVLATALRGFGSGLIASGGDFRAGLIGAASAGWGHLTGPVGSLKNFVGQTVGSGVFSKLSGGRFADGLRLGGMIGFAQFSLVKVQTAWAEHTGGVGEIRGVTVDANGQPTVGPAHGSGTLSVGGVGPFDVRAAIQRVGTNTFDVFMHPSVSMGADMIETGLSLLTGRSALSDQLAGIMGSGAYTNIVGHSQGALLVAQATALVPKDSLAGVHIRALGGPVSQSYAQRAVGLTGAQLEYKANLLDPVSNFLGGQMFRNPARFAGALAGVPMLAVPSISPHRYQCRPQPAPC